MPDNTPPHSKPPAALIECHRCAGLWLQGVETDQKTATCRHCGQRGAVTGVDPSNPARHSITKSRGIQIHKVHARHDADDPGVLRAKRTEMLESRADWAASHADFHVPEYDGHADDLQRLADLRNDSTDEPDNSNDSPSSSGRPAGVPIADRPILDRNASPPDRTRGIHLLGPGSEYDVDGTTLTQAPPSIRAWLPDLLEQLLPLTVRLVQDYARGRDTSYLRDLRRSGEFADCLLEEVLDVDDLDDNTHAEVWQYAYALSDLALKWTNDTYREDRSNAEREIAQLLDVATSIGTGKGPFNAGRHALGHGPIALHAIPETPQALTFLLDGEAWQDANPETLETSLETIALLSESFDVRLALSPSVYGTIQSAIERVQSRPAANPVWLDAWLDLTAPANYTRTTVEQESTEGPADPQARAWEWLAERTDGEGRLRLLAVLDAETPVHVKSLKEDRDIALSESSVDVYVAELERDGLVRVDRNGRYNALTLSEIGACAAEYINPDYSIRDPRQSRLFADHTQTPQRFTSAVYAPNRRDGGRDDADPAAEAWMADTGNPYDTGFVQWLGKAHADNPAIQPWPLTKRVNAAQRGEGVTLVEDDGILDWTNPDQAPDGDGRVTYIGEADGTVAVVTQWGGGMSTLGRLGTALLSDRAISRFLSPDEVGVQFEQLDDAATEEFKKDLSDVLQKGRQIGWLSDENLSHWGNWRERIGQVRSELLSRLGGHAGLDSGLRVDLLRDLHGLLASATQLYDAAGYDVHIQLRVPRTGELIRDEERMEDFLGFLAKTVTKQAGYRDDNGFHSFYRMAIEDRQHKLRFRLPYEVDEGQPEADLTASWSLVGPTIGAVQDDVRDAISNETLEVRERIATGVEDAAVLRIPVYRGGTRPHLRALLREWTQRKGFERTTSDDLDRLARVLEAALSDRERNPSPMDVAEALAQLEARDGRDRLTPGSMARVLSRLPSDRLFPGLPPSARRMAALVMRHPGEVTRQDLIAATSENSVDRHWQKLVALDFIEKTDDGTYRLWMEPWWTPASGREAPANPLGDGLWDGNQRWQDVLYEAVFALRPSAIDGTLFATPVDLDEVIGAAPEVEWLLPILEAYFDVDLSRGRAVREDSGSIATIGRPPRELAPNQQNLRNAAD